MCHVVSVTNLTIEHRLKEKKKCIYFLCKHANKQKGDILAYLLEGGSLALYRRFGPHLQLLAQCHQLLHLCHHQSLFLVNQLEQRERRREERCLSGRQRCFITVLSRGGWVNTHRH